jgi:hypothetical protein
MQLEKPRFIEKITGVQYDILSFAEYKKSIGKPKISNALLAYQIKEDNLDYVIIGRFRYIVINDKAKAYKPGRNYGKRWKNKRK